MLLEPPTPHLPAPQRQDATSLRWRPSFPMILPPLASGYLCVSLLFPSLLTLPTCSTSILRPGLIGHLIIIISLFTELLVYDHITGPSQSGNWSFLCQRGSRGQNAADPPGIIAWRLLSSVGWFFPQWDREVSCNYSLP